MRENRGFYIFVCIGLILNVLLVVFLRIQITSSSKITGETSFSRGVVPSRTFADTIGYPTLGHTVFTYYYPWYDAVSMGGVNWRHWDNGGRTGLPADISSASYPLLGPYRSADPGVLAQHMQWIKQAKIDVIILSWWGQGSFEDANSQAVLDAAAKAGLKVCFQIEPYTNRSTQSMTSDVKYIINTYGSSPAFYRVVRPTLYGPSTSSRPVFFIYSLDGGADTIQMIDAFRNTSYDSIFLGRMDDGMMLTDQDVRTQLSNSHLDGLYNYGDYSITSGYSGTLPSSPDYILIFSASPGFDKSRILNYTPPPSVPRDNGIFYDDSWYPLAMQKAEGVAVLTFNEWNETTGIEPVQSFAADGYTYLDYNGAYALTGTDAQLAYIYRTAFWSDIYKSSTTSLPSSESIVPLNVSSDTYDATTSIQGVKDPVVTSVSASDGSSVTFPDVMHWSMNSVPLDVGENTITLQPIDAGTTIAPVTVTVNRHHMGNIKGYGVVDLTDLSILAKDWHRGKAYGDSLYNPMSDMVNNDGSVTLADLSALAKNWEQ